MTKYLGLLLAILMVLSPLNVAFSHETNLPLEKTGNLSAETGTFTTTNTVNSVDFDYYVNGVKKYHEAF